MGCISSNEVKKPRNKDKDNYKTNQSGIYKSKLGKSYQQKLPSNNQASKQQALPNQEHHQQKLLRITKINSKRMASLYKIEETLLQSTRLQGPKLVTNRIDGTSKVLRVFNSHQIDQKRLEKYYHLIGFQVYTDEENNTLIIDQLCTGPTVCQIFQSHPNSTLNDSVNRKQQQMHAYSILLQVFDIIQQFHKMSIFIGNLNMFSFKKVSYFDDRIRLVDFNLYVNQDQNINFGHAYSNSHKSDWQFFGYLLQFYLSDKSPVFIQHKMQYIANDKVLYQSLISSLLKGKQISRNQLQQINPLNLQISNNDVVNGYKFRKDLNKLLQIRKRRTKHKSTYYGRNDVMINQNGSSENQIINQQLNYYYLPPHYGQHNNQLAEQFFYRLQTQRVMKSIEKYIENITPTCEDHFINYCKGGDGLRKLREIFFINDRQKKIAQFKQYLPQIK